MEPEFGALTLKLNQIEAKLGPVEMTKALAVVGVKAQGDMVEAIVPALGPDRQFSGWKRAGTAHTDLRVEVSQFTVIPKPYGVWIVADKGRRPGSAAPSRGKTKNPAILKTPWGPRTYYKATPLRIGPTRGKNSLTIGKTLIRTRSGARLELEIQKRIRETGIGRG